MAKFVEDRIRESQSANQQVGTIRWYQAGAPQRIPSLSQPPRTKRTSVIMRAVYIVRGRIMRPEEVFSSSETSLIKSPTGKRDHLTVAKLVPPDKLRLVFEDDWNGVLSFDDLELNATHLKMATLKLVASGTAIEIESRFGDKVRIDSSFLRCRADKSYADEVDKAIGGPSNEELSAMFARRNK